MQMFVNVRKYNGLYVFSLIYPRSRRFIHQKPRRTHCPCLYYANSSTCRQTLLRGGDISVNPGSLAKQKSAKCEEYEKTVRLNQQSVTYSVYGLCTFNTQSMVSTCDEFVVTINEYPLNVITLSENRLKDNPSLLDFVSVPGYTTIFRNRESIKGDSVGAYIRNDINFKHRKDIENLQLDLEHLCRSRSEVAASTAKHYIDLHVFLETLTGLSAQSPCLAILRLPDARKFGQDVNVRVRPYRGQGRESSPEILNRHAQLRSEKKKTYRTFFVNLFSEKVFKLSALGITTFDCVESVFVCKPQLSLEPLISVRFSRFEGYIFYDLT